MLPRGLACLPPPPNPRTHPSSYSAPCASLPPTLRLILYLLYFSEPLWTPSPPIPLVSIRFTPYTSPSPPPSHPLFFFSPSPFDWPPASPLPLRSLFHYKTRVTFSKTLFLIQSPIIHAACCARISNCLVHSITWLNTFILVTTPSLSCSLTQLSLCKLLDHRLQRLNAYPSYLFAYIRARLLTIRLQSPSSVLCIMDPEIFPSTLNTPFLIASNCLYCSFTRFKLSEPYSWKH